MSKKVRLGYRVPKWILSSTTHAAHILFFGLIVTDSVYGTDTTSPVLQNCESSSANRAQTAGQIVATYQIPQTIRSLNGLSWDGKQLWAVDYHKQDAGRLSRVWEKILDKLWPGEKEDVFVARGIAYRLNINETEIGGTPSISRRLHLGLPAMEGLAHDRISKLYVGSRTKGSRSSASILEIDDSSGDILQRHSEYAWPDGAAYGNYKDADGIAYDSESVFWSVNADHSNAIGAGVQVLSKSRHVINRFWLPDSKVNDIAVVNDYLIYKPRRLNIVRIVDVAGIAAGSSAKAIWSIDLIGGDINNHWGVAHDGADYLYISQDVANGQIWKVCLPIRRGSR